MDVYLWIVDTDSRCVFYTYGIWMVDTLYYGCQFDTNILVYLKHKKIFGILCYIFLRPILNSHSIFKQRHILIWYSCNSSRRSPKFITSERAQPASELFSKIADKSEYEGTALVKLFALDDDAFCKIWCSGGEDVSD